MEIKEQVTKYYGKEEKLLLRSNFSSFPQYLLYVSNFRSQITYSFVKFGCSIYCFPHFCNSDISRYGYLKVFQRVPPGIQDNESSLYFYPEVKEILFVLFVLRFYGPVNPMGSCRALSVYLTTRLLGRLSPLSGLPVLCTFFHQKLTTPLLESAEGRE